MGAYKITRQQSAKDKLCRNTAGHKNGSSPLIPAGQMHCLLDLLPNATRLAERIFSMERYCHDCAMVKYGRYRSIVSKLRPGQIAYALKQTQR